MKPNYFARHMRWVLRLVTITLIIMVTINVQISASPFGQNITISKKNAALPEIFMIIYQQTGYYFIYKDDLLKDAKRVTIDVKNASIQEVLAIVFEGQPLTYSISDHIIIVKHKLERDPKQGIPIKIRGRVLNNKGEPLEGADVMLTGTYRGTQADANGNFVIGVNKNENLISISFTGYETKTVNAQKDVFVTVILHLSLNPLDQVQVIAYGTTSKRLNTGSVSTVTGSEIQKQPISNPLAALEGRIAGVEIQQNTGIPGGSFSVKIRGQNSLRNSLTNNGNLPLYLIDGVPFPSASISSIYTSSANLQFGSPLSAINPADIESIDILKDADATAIYGSRGSNGVVLITTKKGKAGKTKLDVNAYTGVGEVSNRMQLLNRQEYLEMRMEAKANDQETPYSYDHDINGNWDSTRYTDWQKTLIGGHAIMNNLQASVSGGNANTQFLLGGGYLKETTVFPGDFADQKRSVHFNLNHSSENHRFKINMSGSYLIDQNNLFPNDLTNLATSLAPDAPALYNANGQLNWQNNTWVNPVSLLERKYTSTTNNLIGNLILSYQIATGLLVRTSVGYNNFSVQELSTVPIASLNPVYISQGSSQFANSSLHSWIAEPQAEYHNYLFNGVISVLAGMTFQQNNKSSQTLQATGFANDALLANLQAASFVNVIATDNSDYKYEGGFARINYNFQEKYLLNFTGRRDGSSRFGSNRQFANFGSAGAAWIFSNSALVKSRLPFISFGKFRASYGITGSDQIGDYGFLDSYSPTSYPYQIAGLIPARLANPNYAWETNRKMEGALELGLFHDRIFFSAAFFKNQTSDQLVRYSLSGVTGFNSIQANLPAIVQNSGWEFEWTSSNIHTRDFSWSSSVNLTIPSNKLIAYPNITASPYAYTYEVGESLYKKDLFQSTGVDPQTGLYSYYDVDKNGSIDYPTDLQFLKSVGSRYYGGFQNKMTYRNISLSFVFQFVSQTGYNYLQNYSNPGTLSNQPAVVLARWQKPGDKTSIEQYTSDVTPAFFAYLNAYSSDLILSDASFIRLKNISISYEFPQGLIQKFHGQLLRLYFQAQNVFTLNHYKGLDPENQNSNVLPPLRVLTAGLQFSF